MHHKHTPCGLNHQVPVKVNQELLCRASEALHCKRTGFSSCLCCPGLEQNPAAEPPQRPVTAGHHCGCGGWSAGCSSRSAQWPAPRQIG